MTGEENNEKLRNGLLLSLESSINEILGGIGEIRSDIKALALEGGQLSKELKRTESKLASALKKTDERIAGHLKDHSENAEYMGVAPYLRRYGKKHWKALFGGLLAAQIMLAALIMKYGIEKILALFKG